MESILSGGIILLCADGSMRDMSSVHGTYKKVAETVPALEMTAVALDKTGPSRADIIFDSPVSNSGELARLAGRIFSGRS